MKFSFVHLFLFKDILTNIFSVLLYVMRVQSPWKIIQNVLLGRKSFDPSVGRKSFDPNVQLSSTSPSPITMLIVIHESISCFHRLIWFFFLMKFWVLSQEDLEGLFKCPFCELSGELKASAWWTLFPPLHAVLLLKNINFLLPTHGTNTPGIDMILFSIWAQEIKDFLSCLDTSTISFSIWTCGHSLPPCGKWAFMSHEFHKSCHNPNISQNLSPGTKQQSLKHGPSFTKINKQTNKQTTKLINKHF